jgi:undecaprenyl-diphosphatase
MVSDDQRYLGKLRSVAIVLWAVVVVMYVMMAIPEARSWLQTIDDQVLTMAVDGEGSPWVDIAKTLTFIGSSTIVFPFVMIVAGFLYWKKRMTATLFWLATLAVAETLIWVTKVIYERPRPPMALVTTHSYSFPSGHAGTAAAVAAGIVLLLVMRGMKHWYFDLLAIGYVVAIAWSRVYLRAHWLSDVFTGAALGAAVAITVFLVVSLLVKRGRLPAGDDSAIVA